MIIHQVDGLRFYSFESFENQGIISAAFTRHGGNSPVPWNGLNVGGTVGDSLENVVENRRRLFQAAGRPQESIFDVWQVHSNDVVVADQPRSSSQPYVKADAILTDRNKVTLFMRFADCVPILLFDPIHKAIGLVHAGWVGTVNQIAKVTVEAMQAEFGTDPKQLLAGIGPSICATHYPIGPDVIARVKETFEADSRQLLSGNGTATHFDLWNANRLILEKAGISHIEISGMCTACHPEDWFSHRGEKGKTGRFGVLFALMD